MIVHFGAGNFHRAHQAAYVDALGDPDWFICGVGTRAADAPLRDALRANDYRYTLRLLAPDGGVDARVIQSIREYLLVTGDADALAARLVDPATRIVSLTITEGGYVDNDALFALLAHALVARRDRGVAPFTVMSCDNITHNGAVARAAVQHAASRADAEWIAEHVAFPSSMVDRITPATTDPLTVSAEAFGQWVLEDTFSAGRPELQRVGVQLVHDVAPYETMKLRLLNGAHQAMAYAGLLLGHAYVHDAVADPSLAALLRAYFAETRPAVPAVPGVDLDDYCATLLARFGNAAIADTLARLAESSWDRVPTFVLPTVVDNLRAGRPVRVAAFVAATWAAHYADAEHSLSAVRADPVFDDAYRAAQAALAGGGVRAAIAALGE